MRRYSTVYKFNIILLKRAGKAIATITVLDPFWFEHISSTLDEWLPRSFDVGELSIVIDDESEEE